MPVLKAEPTLKDYQRYVRDLEQERGFADQDVIAKCLMLGEEVGELFKAVRKARGVKIDANSAVTSVSEELADIFIFICSIANKFEVDLEDAFRDKEKINAGRVWE